MQALEFLHSHNIYYGDIKEANIQIFRDFSIKLGGFGGSIKLKKSPDSDGTPDSYDLKGYTPGYTTPLIESSFKDNTKVERKDLLTNDFYALYKTFHNVYQQFKTLIHNKSYFCQLLGDIEDNNDLTTLVKKYEQLLQNDDAFIYEEKVFAIPNILKLHRHGIIV